MKRLTIALFFAAGIAATPGCGKQQDSTQPAGAPAAAKGEPPAPGAGPAAGALEEDPGVQLERLLRDRVTRFAPSPLWTNRLGRYLLSRGGGDEAALLLDAAAAGDPGNADFLLDAVLARASRAGFMQGADVTHVRALLGDVTDPTPPAGVAGAAPTQAFGQLPPAAPPGPAFVPGQQASPGVAGAPAMAPSQPGQEMGGGAAGMAPPNMAAPGMAAPGMAPPNMAPPGMAPPAMANGDQAAGAAPGATPPAGVRDAAPAVSFEDAVAKARAATQQGDLARATALWQEALKFDANSPDGWLGLADVTLMRGDATAAIGHYKEALRLAPKNAVVAKRLGDACFQSRQNDCAFSAYEVATAGEPVSQDGYVWVRWAHVANQLGKRAVAEKALAAAATILPADDRDLNTVRKLLSEPEQK